MGRKAQIKDAAVARMPLGGQLSQRVKSGAITPKRAQRTAAQRQLFKKAYGTDWRQKVYGQGGARGLEGNTFGRGEVAAKRTQALLRAKRKLG